METTEHDNMSDRVASFSCYLDTAKENIVHRVSAQDQINPIPLTSSSKTNPPSMKSPFTIKFSKSKDHHTSQDHSTLTNLRVDSFSYLNTTDNNNNFVFQVPGPIQDPTTAFTFSHEIQKDGEISVFNADKYFNMKLEYQSTDKFKKIEGPAVNNIPPRVGSNNMIRPKSTTTTATTPSMCSEASSWNSQNPLLTQTKLQQKKAIVARKSIFGSCRPGRPCFDKKAVRTDEIVAQGGYYAASKPAPLTSAVNLPNPGGGQSTLAANLDAPRPSIEVFGSGTTSKVQSDDHNNIVARNLERKLSMLTWDAIPKGQNNLPTSTLGSSVCDDMASEASSDLFEIENISGSIYPLVAPEAVDDISSCMSPTSLYAPSEASIQWSVVTASAAPEYVSDVVSNNNDEASVSVAGDVVVRRNVNNVKGAKRVDKEGPVKARPGGLLGCKSHKAVDVAENHVCHKRSI